MVQQIGLAGRLDLTSFNKNVQSFMKALTDMNKEVTKIASESAAGAKQAAESAGALGVNWQRVKDIVTGVVIIDVFRQISRGLKSVIRDAFDATAVFQQLMIMLEAILARDFAKQWGIPVADALEQIKDQAQQLLGWVRKVAVTTPFSVESIATALAYGQAFGFNVAQSKRLTLATGDFVAGMGLTDEHMQRIIYNFGQMLASGRVLGRELRDLANNFVPIRDITQKLADEAGIPFQEMKKAMSEANVSAEQFIGAFVELAEADFAGAMERMSRTIRGVQQNVSDFIRTLFGLELLGPVMDRIAGLAADALDAAFSPETIRAFTILGETLVVAFDNIYNAVTKLLAPAVSEFFAALGFGAPTVMSVAKAILVLTQIFVEFVRTLRNVITKVTEFINTLSERFGTSLGDIVKKAGSWGANIVIALAEGMAKAITYLVQVLQAIARIFTYWLSGHSPPKLLPELTAWGKAAMESYLKGWASADFGLFNDIASVVTSFFRSIANKIPETDLIPRILGARSAIQNAIQDMKRFGQVTAGSINKIVASINAATGPLKNFIKESFEFAKISAIVNAVRKALDFDIKLNVPTNILGQTVSSLQDLVKLALKFKGALGVAFQGYVKALGDAERANERVAREQRYLNDITEKYSKELSALKKLQDALRKKQDVGGRLKQIEAAIATGLLTDEEKRRLEMEKEGTILEHKITAMENERDIAVDAARERLNMEKTLADAAEARMSMQRRLTQALATEQLSAAQEQLDAARSLVELQIDQNNLLKEQADLLKRLAAGAGAGGLDLEIPGLEFEGFMDDFEDSLLASKEEIAKAIDELRAEVFAQVRGFIRDLLSPFDGAKEELGKLLAGISGAFEAAKENTSIQKFVVSLYYLQDRMQQALANLRIFWEENGPAITEIIRNFFTELGEVISPDSATLIGTIADKIMLFGDSVKLASENLVENGPQIQESIQGWVDWVFDTGIPKLQDFGKTLTEDIIPGIKNFAGIIKDNAPTIIAILGALGTAFLALRPAITVLSVLSKIGLALIPLQLLFTGLMTTVSTFGTAFGGLDTVILLARVALSEFITKITPFLGPIALALLAIGAVVLVIAENFEFFKKFVLSTFKAIKKAIAPALKPLQKAFKDLAPRLKELKKALAPVAKFLLGVFRVIGYVILGILIPALTLVIGIISGLIRAIIQGFTGFLAGFENIIGGITKIITGVVDVITGIWDVIKSVFTGDWEGAGEGLKKIVVGIIEIIWGLGETIVGIFESFLKSAWGFIEGFVMGVVDFFVSLYDQLVGGSIIPDMLADMLAAFVGFFADAIAGFSEWIGGVVTTIVEKATEFKDAGVEFITNLIAGIRESIYGEDGLIAKIKKYIDYAIKRIKAEYYKWKFIGTELIKEMIAGIKEKVEAATGLYAKFKEFIQNTIDKITELKDDFIQAGVDIISGLITGLWQKAVDLYTAVAKIIKNALGIAEEESEASSDSKRMMRLGQNWMTGLQAGVMSEAQNTKTMMENLFSGLTEGPADLQLAFANAVTNAGSLDNLSGNLDVRHMMQPTSGASSSLTQPSPSNTTIQNLNVEVNASYSEVQSEASIYYDVRAALAHIAR